MTIRADQATSSEVTTTITGDCILVSIEPRPGRAIMFAIKSRLDRVDGLGDIEIGARGDITLTLANDLFEPREVEQAVLEAIQPLVNPEPVRIQVTCLSRGARTVWKIATTVRNEGGTLLLAALRSELPHGSLTSTPLYAAFADRGYNIVIETDPRVTEQDVERAARTLVRRY